MSKFGLGLVVFAIGVSLVVLAFYLLQFGPPLFGLSDSPEAWGQFGDYLGGTLGAAFGLLAFLGVLFTIYLQSHQIDHLKKQAGLEEMQRVLSSISKNIDDILASDARLVVPVLRQKLQESGNRSMAVYSLVAAAGSAATGAPSEQLNEQTLARLLNDSKTSVQIEAEFVSAELGQLAWCIHRYAEAQGNPVIGMFYQRRYQDIAAWMAAAELLSSDEAASFFRVKERIEVMKQTPRPA